MPCILNGRVDVRFRGGNRWSGDRGQPVIARPARTASARASSSSVPHRTMRSPTSASRSGSAKCVPARELGGPPRRRRTATRPDGATGRVAARVPARCPARRPVRCPAQMPASPTPPEAIAGATRSPVFKRHPHVLQRVGGRGGGSPRRREAARQPPHPFREHPLLAPPIPRPPRPALKRSQAPAPGPPATGSARAPPPPPSGCPRGIVAPYAPLVKDHVALLRLIRASDGETGRFCSPTSRGARHGASTVVEHDGQHRRSAARRAPSSRLRASSRYSNTSCTPGCGGPCRGRRWTGTRAGPARAARRRAAGPATRRRRAGRARRRRRTRRGACRG